jgi:hypothetical protein
MQLFGTGKKTTEGGAQTEDKAKKSAADLKKQLNHLLKLVAHYETTIVAVAVAVLLSLTSLRMLHYMDPQIDDSKVQESLAKNKRIHLDPIIVEKIEQLQDNGASTPKPATSTNNRTNPFTE